MQLTKRLDGQNLFCINTFSLKCNFHTSILLWKGTGTFDEKVYRSLPLKHQLQIQQDNLFFFFVFFFCFFLFFFFFFFFFVVFFFTKTCLFKILKILPQKKKKKKDILHIFAENIDCGYPLEPPLRGGSNAYPQSMLLSRNKKNNVYPRKPQFYYIKVGLGDQNYIGIFFFRGNEAWHFLWIVC